MEYNVVDLAKQISETKEIVLEIREVGKDVPAVKCNIDRILASIKMLEININDVADL